MKWKLLVTRETVLLERYLRAQGYSEMFGENAKVKMNYLFIVNKNGLTSQYIEEDEDKKRLELCFQEYQAGYMQNHISYWEEIMTKIITSAEMFVKIPSYENLKIFIKYYKIGRAIVFYPSVLARAFELHHQTKDLGLVEFWHEKAETTTSKAWDLIKPTIMTVGKKFELREQEIMFFLPEELLLLLKNGKTVDPFILQQRYKYFVIYVKKSVVNFYTGTKARKLEETEIKKETFSLVDEIKGTVAWKGQVKGRVRIVNTSKQMNEMQRGEILVSVMTTPRLVPAVEKAAAIVTEEGGITCHAAVVAREFNKPCIVGTKIATKIFKDGDLIEVDAIKGIVRKIK